MIRITYIKGTKMKFKGCSNNEQVKEFINKNPDAIIIKVIKDNDIYRR